MMLRHDARFIPPNRFPFPHALGIRFGDFLFTEPVPFEGAICAPTTSGIYVLLISDATWVPRQFQPVYFGEFGVPAQSPMSAGEQMRCLRIAAGRTLYLAVHTVPSQYAAQIAQMKERLIQQYTPIGNPEAALGGGHSLEKKLSEHEIVLKLILAAIAPAVSTTAETKKRAVGFIRN